MTGQHFLHLGSVKDVKDFARYLTEHQITIPCDSEVIAGNASPLGAQVQFKNFHIGNRFAIHPMEGWDGTPDGKPSELTIRRWQNFGRSGAKLIWGGEAVAVRHEGRANPNQLLINRENLSALAELRNSLITAHKEQTGTTDGLCVGLQLTHSGRYSKPNRKDRGEPRILYRHPILDRRLNLPADYPIITDGEIRQIIEA